MSYTAVAQTIIEQLGGEKRLRLMIGAKSFIADKGKLGLGRVSIGFPSNLTKPRINVIRIELTPADLYTVECDYVHRDRDHNVTIKEVARADEVFVGDLTETIYKLTGGLVLQMPKLIGGGAG